MKKIIILVAVAFAMACGLKLRAQEVDTVAVELAPEGYEWVDSVIVVPTSRCNEELKGKSIWDVMPKKYLGSKADVNVTHSAAIDSAMTRHIATNPQRVVKGYRVRIYFGNKQNARSESEEILKAFRAKYPLVPSYLGYQYPYFKVTVGDFRTKNAARKFLGTIVKTYPKAFLVQENIEYPSLDENVAMQYDTLRILRPLPVVQEENTQTTE